jgi:hypothetical protein
MNPTKDPTGNRNLALVAQLTTALQNAAIEVDPQTTGLLRFVYSDTQLRIEVAVQEHTGSVVLQITHVDRLLPLMLVRDKSDIPEIMTLIRQEISIADAATVAANSTAERESNKLHALFDEVAGIFNFERHHDLAEKTVFSIDLSAAFGDDYRFATIDATPKHDNRLRFYQSNQFGACIDGPAYYTGAPDYQGVYAAFAQLKNDMIAQLAGSAGSPAW